MDDHGTETPREELAVPPPTGKRRVMFHREDLKNKISTVVHRRPRAATEGAAEIAADLDSSLVEQRPKWFKKIFPHRRHSAGDALQLGVNAGASEEDEPRTAATEHSNSAEVDAAAFDESPSSASSDSSLSSSELAGQSRGAADSLLDLGSAKSCASQEHGGALTASRTNRLKSRFRRLHTRSSNASNSSSHRSDESLSRSPTSNAKTPTIPLTRSSTTGTMLSNAGGMSRRSYRNKLDHALRKAHLTRRTYGLNPTTCGGGLDDSKGGGFMMKPDKEDQKKVQSSEAFQSVLLEASRDFPAAHR